MPDIFDEVEEDLRAERARSLARRFAGTGVAALVLILVGTGAAVYWKQSRAAATDAVAGQFITAARDADRASAAPGGPDLAGMAPAERAFAGIANSGPAGYRVLARLRLAALQWQSGQHKQAVATWQAVSDDGSAPSLLRDLATLTSAQRQLDTADPVLLKQRLQGLTGADNRWRPLAEQVIALLDIRTGHTAEAAAIMQRLTMDFTAPEGIRQMAGDLLTTLPADALAPKVATPKPPVSVPAAHAAAAHG